MNRHQSNYRRSLPLAALLVAATWIASASSALAGGIVQVNPDGSVTKMTIDGMSGTTYINCLNTGGSCDICGTCHAKPSARYDEAKHESNYFPRFTATLRSGETQSIGGRTLANDGKSLCVTDTRGGKHCYPAINSKVFKDASGKLLAIYSTQPPKK